MSSSSTSNTWRIDRASRARFGGVEVRHLEHHHVAAVAAAAVEQPPGRGVRLNRRDDLEERVADREHRVAQTESATPGSLNGSPSGSDSRNRRRPGPDPGPRAPLGGVVARWATSSSIAAFGKETAGFRRRYPETILCREADSTEPRSADLAELSALADGTLDPARRDEVRARIAGSPQLTELYERERRVVETLHEMRRDRPGAGPAADKLATADSGAQGSRLVAETSFQHARDGRGRSRRAAAVVLALVLLLPAGRQVRRRSARRPRSRPAGRPRRPPRRAPARAARAWTCRRSTSRTGPSRLARRRTADRPDRRPSRADGLLRVARPP